jgi:electron transfer flavoprotein alpha subunit
MSIQLKRTVTVKVIVTEEFKKYLAEELKMALTNLDNQIKQVEDQGKKLVTTLKDQGDSGKKQAQSIVAQMQTDRSQYVQTRAELEKKIKDASLLPLNSEFTQGTLDGNVEVSVGDNLYEKLGGYGVGGANGFKPLHDLAKVMGAAIGASRRAVDAGWIPYRHQIGLTGRVVRPKLYIAVGISGQIQHLAGMNSSETIVCINKDPEAPLMKLATFSVEGDFNEILPAMQKELTK